MKRTQKEPGKSKNTSMVSISQAFCCRHQWFYDQE